MTTARHAARAVAVLLISATLVAACDDDPAAPAEERFTAALTGEAERPLPVLTTATGSGTVTISGDRLDYVVTVNGIDSVTASHIHVGSADVAGPILLDLFTGPTTGRNFSGQLTRGTMFRSTINSRGVSFDSVAAAIRNGNAYINVHTRRFGPGEIRGQLGR